MGRLSWENRASKNMIRYCLNCGKKFKIWPSDLKYNRGKFCSHSCRSSGKFNSHWIGGRRMGHKYIRIWQPNHPYAQKEGYVFEHRLIMEKLIGRYLSLQEVVHHKNKNTKDNRPENLELFESDSLHRHFTIRGKNNPNYRHGRNIQWL